MRKPITISPRFEGGIAPQDPKRISTPNPPCAMKYGCGHVMVEHRGNMGRDLEATIRAQCAGIPCPRCVKENAK